MEICPRCGEEITGIPKKDYSTGKYVCRECYEMYDLGRWDEPVEKVAKNGKAQGVVEEDSL